MYEELSKSKDMSIYDKENLMDEEYDDTELGRIADERIQSFQADSSQVEMSCFSSISDSNLPTWKLHKTVDHQEF